MFTFANIRMIRYPILNYICITNCFLMFLFPLACEGRRIFCA
uniref:Uncharacterized protein n=1 Tax=CrAss-like virus sp. ctyM420 TaxID=2828014 RepID=A0A8S5TJ02_9CAUD|nr:MAG TPA: hypothetical protein [CrAss-like virus sp. ctyM420]